MTLQEISRGYEEAAVPLRARLRERKDRPFTRQELAVLFAAMLLET